MEIERSAGELVADIEFAQLDAFSHLLFSSPRCSGTHALRNVDPFDAYQQRWTGRIGYIFIGVRRNKLRSEKKKEKTRKTIRPSDKSSEIHFSLILISHEIWQSG